MNKTNLRSFAVAARNELIERIRQKAYELGITEDKVKKAQIASSDSIFINGKPLDKREVNQRNNLIEQIKARGYDQVIEEVAYTWFNRFCALRFMEVNDYLPTRTRVLSSTQPGVVEPDMMRDALHLIEDLDLDPDTVLELKERKDNNDLFKYLLVKQCNSLSLILPFLFGKLEDYTEILFPDNLLKDGSILRTMVNSGNIPEEDWEDVEIIGWLYQYYISEKKDQVFADLKKNIKITPENIPAATQLFTPHWIVRYLVENSLGRLWMLNHPDSRLIERMDYYIKPVDTETDYLKISSPEEIKICDPACGSGHMLTYAFDLLYAIYEEAGYMAREIPSLILANNLYGIEIDQRAGQLAALALTMKARGKNNRFFRKLVEPNICLLQDIRFENDELKHYVDEIGPGMLSTKLFPTLRQFEEVNNFGSLIRPKETDVYDTLKRLLTLDLPSNMFVAATHKKVIQVLRQVDFLNSKYHVAVANPPYMGTGGVNDRLKAFAGKYYSASKSDLYAMFIERNLNLTVQSGLVAMVTMQSWMFLSSYEVFRKQFLSNATIISMLHLGTRAFDSISGEVVSTTAFVAENYSHRLLPGSYIRLVDGKCEADKQADFKHKKKNPWRAFTSDFEQIPGSPVVYWASPIIRESFANMKPMSTMIETREGLTTGNNDLFLRQWYEVPLNSIGFGINTVSKEESKHFRWFPYIKGGSFRRWYGNYEFVVNWENDGKLMRQYMDAQTNRVRSHNYNGEYAFREGFSWSGISSGKFGVRHVPIGFMFDAKGPMGYTYESVNIYTCEAFLNSNIADHLLKMLAPTLDFKLGHITNLPIDEDLPVKLSAHVQSNIAISKTDWDSFEISWDFYHHPLFYPQNHDPLISKTYGSLCRHWHEMTLEMQRLEEENNRIFIEAYGLQDELTPDVPLSEITLTCNPYYRYATNKTDEELEALLLTDTVKEYISYAVGCMFGRYSLDKEGLVFAGGDFDPDQCSTFPADQDNVIPVLADDHFKDDVVARFVDFVRITFSDATLDENLDFIADALSRKSSETARDTIRRYFVNDFYKDHVQMYKKRPIYWMFTSGKEKAFNCLVYLHRYQPDTIATLRTDYLHRLQEFLEVERKNLQRVIAEESGSPSARAAAKQLPRLDKQIQELNKYDELVHHYADMRISLDLDDGVKVNYAKLQELLAKI